MFFLKMYNRVEQVLKRWNMVELDGTKVEQGGGIVGTGAQYNIFTGYLSVLGIANWQLVGANFTDLILQPLQ